jgi:serine phosphatase RsbU (regulator of sigma subunit)
MVLEMTAYIGSLRDEERILRGEEAMRTALFPESSLSLQQLSCHVEYAPASGKIGGDFYGIVGRGPSSMCFVIGDIEGHGRGASLGMVPVIAEFRRIAKQSISTKHILAELSRLCAELRIRGTAVCGIVDHRRQTPRIVVTSAGHFSLVIIRPGHQVIVPGADEYNIGMLGNDLEEGGGEASAELEDGDIVVAFTDGIIRADSNPLAVYGPVTEIVWNMFDSPPKAIAEKIVSTLRETDAAVRDDATVLVVRVGGTCKVEADTA